MSRTTRTIVTVYAAASVWLVVMTATAFALMEPMGSLAAEFGLSAPFQTITSMAISIVSATVAAGATWAVLHGRISRANQPVVARGKQR